MVRGHGPAAVARVALLQRHDAQGRAVDEAQAAGRWLHDRVAGRGAAQERAVGERGADDAHAGAGDDAGAPACRARQGDHRARVELDAVAAIVDADHPTGDLDRRAGLAAAFGDRRARGHHLIERGQPELTAELDRPHQPVRIAAGAVVVVLLGANAAARAGLGGRQRLADRAFGGVDLIQRRRGVAHPALAERRLGRVERRADLRQRAPRVDLAQRAQVVRRGA
ncbi:MAG: hypothetical protein IPH80_13710 [Myxococcales bacterium]|nr:hypothetical protein [Myxococcales bacterium]